MRVGLLFGSFNPVHTGHLLIAQYMASFTELEEVWLVLSPQNPFKNWWTLIPIRHRLAMLELAAAGNPHVRVCDVELGLPVPSFTFDTLQVLVSSYPNHAFSLITGADSAASLSSWKNGNRIIQQYPVYVYPRSGFQPGNEVPKSFIVTKSPVIDISSTFIRQGLKAGHSMRYWLPASVIDYIKVNRIQFT